MKPALEKLVAHKLLWAYQDGSPVAPRTESDATEMAALAHRRWNSYGRRNKNIPDTVDHRINDLARGLAEKSTVGGWKMVGRLINDYQWLAEQIAPLLAAENEVMQDES